VNYTIGVIPDCLAVPWLAEKARKYLGDRGISAQVVAGDRWGRVIALATPYSG